jgi:hypothetical protein
MITPPQCISAWSSHFQKVKGIHCESLYSNVVRFETCALYNHWNTRGWGMSSRRTVTVIDRSSAWGYVLLVPGLWTLAILFMMGRTSNSPILFPTVSELLEDWPYITPLFFGAGLSSLFISIVLVSTDWQLLLAYLSMVSAWGVVGTSNSGYFHMVFTSLLFICSFTLLYLCNRSTLQCIIAFTLLISATGASIAIRFLASDSDASNTAYQVLGVSELLYLSIYVWCIRQWVMDQSLVYPHLDTSTTIYFW